MTSEEILFDAEERMEGVLSRLQEELASIRVGKRDMVSSSILVGFMRVLEERHGDRLVSQEDYNKLVSAMGTVERLYTDLKEAKPVQETTEQNDTV